MNAPKPSPATTLDKLDIGGNSRIIAISEGEDSLEAKLREIGFAEGDEVELLARGPLGGQPLSVRLNRTIIALRKNEAALVKIEALSSRLIRD